MANYYFMECCFEHEKTRIIEECNVMGCERKHHFQEYFIEKKDDRKKLTRFCCLDRKQLGRIGVALRWKQRHFAQNVVIIATYVMIF